MNYTQKTVIVIGISLIFRLILGFNLGFGVDESYMLAQASQFQLSYVDHPPLHVWLAGAMMKIAGVSKFVRLPFILLFAFTSWFLFLISKKLYDEKAGFYAVLLLNLSAFFIISPALMVVPDGLLLLFLSASLLIFLKIHQGSSPKLWLLFGIALGLATLSKYHGLLFGLCFLAFMLFDEKMRAHLKTPYPYIGALIAVLLQAPVLIWNMQNEWISFTFQAARGGAKRFRPEQAVTMLLGQILWLLPHIFVTILLAFRKVKAPTLLLFLSLPIIILFTLIPLWGDRGLPHWAMPGWFFLFTVAGAYLAEYHNKKIFIIISALLIPVLAFFAVIQSHTNFFNLKNDPTLEAYDWQFEHAEVDFIIATSWIQGGKLWVNGKGKTPVYVYSNDQRNFGVNRKLEGKRGYLLTTANNAACIAKSLENYFDEVDFIVTKLVTRSKNDAGFKIHFYYIEGLKKPFELKPKAEISSPPSC